MNWAPRVKAAKIRRLYRSVRGELCDENVLLDVGWALYQRCEDVVDAVTALHLGEVPCPGCGETVQRKSVPKPTARQKADLFRVHHREGWFHCEHCQKRLLWQDCRDALRRLPRCFDCFGRLRKRGTDLSCACGKSWQLDKYRASLSRRLLLPCPYCRCRLRRPIFDRHPLDDPEDRSSEELEFRCSKCNGMLSRSGPLLTCGSCGHQVRWRSYWKSIKRRDETLCCGSCCHEFRWQAWRKKALDYSTGNPSPAFEFLKHWPASEAMNQRMMHVDVLVQALHGQGALAPIFIEGSKDSIRQLLDELAAAP